MGTFFTHLRATLFEKTFSQYAESLPKEFLSDKTDTQKTSLGFKLYTHLLYEQIRALEQLQKEDTIFVEKVQLLRLKKIITLATKTLWWKNYFNAHSIHRESFHTLDALYTIPPINRNDIVDVQKKDFLLVNEEDPSLIWRNSSGSTTGTPLRWGVNKTSLIVNALVDLLAQLEKHGFSFKQSGSNNFFMHYNMFMTADKHAFKWFALSDFHAPQNSSSEKVQELLSVITNTKQLVIFTGPNELIPLVECFENAGLQPHIPFIITVGSPLRESVRQVTARYFRSQIFSIYGMQETGVCGIECKSIAGAYHALSDRIILEILTEQGKPVTSGQPGLITVTCLDNTVMPLLRYQPGDVGAFISSSACNCGNRFALFKILQRTTDVIRFSDGSTMSASPILRFFNRVPYIYSVKRFQVEQTKLDHIIIRLETRVDLPSDAVEKLHGMIKRVFKGKLQAKVEQRESIVKNGLKFKVFTPLKQ